MKRSLVSFGGAVSLILLALTLTASPSWSDVRSWHVTAGADDTEFRFHSKATLESFEGKSSDLSGSIMLDPEDLSTLKAELVADIASLDTGLSLRNKHMRENVMHTEEFPTAIFVVDTCQAPTLGAGQELMTTVQGNLTVHGTTQRVEAEVVAMLLRDNSLQLEATMRIKLSDFGIKRPRMLLLKVAEEVDITVLARATPGPPPKRAPQ